MSILRVVHPPHGEPLIDPIDAVLRSQCAAWETIRQDDEAPSGLGTLHILRPPAPTADAPFDWAISSPELGGH